MTTKEISQRFHELAQTGQWDQIQEELYADHCVSIEPEHAPGPSRVEGMEAIKAKGKTFEEMIEKMHGGFSHPPIVSENHFAVYMGFDADMKGMGRQNMTEIAVYEVKDGKIVKEQFFY